MASRVESTMVCSDKDDSGGYDLNGFSLCINQYGDVYSLGYSEKGANGFEEQTEGKFRKQITSLCKITSVSCGFILYF